MPLLLLSLFHAYGLMFDITSLAIFRLLILSLMLNTFTPLRRLSLIPFSIIIVYYIDTYVTLLLVRCYAIGISYYATLVTVAYVIIGCHI